MIDCGGEREREIELLRGRSEVGGRVAKGGETMKATWQAMGPRQESSFV